MFQGAILIPQAQRWLFSHSVMSNSWWPRGAARQASLSFTISQSLLKVILVMLSNHLILCHPFLLWPSIFPSIRVFSNESALCIRWPKYWSFSFSVSTSNEYSGLISFRIDWFDLLADQGPLKGLLQHYKLKESILWHSAFFMVQLSHPYVTTGTTVALTRRTFVSIVTSLLLDTLSRFVTAFLPRSKCLELFKFKIKLFFIFSPLIIFLPSLTLFGHSKTISGNKSQAQASMLSI